MRMLNGQVRRVLERLGQSHLRLHSLEVCDVQWILVGLALRVQPEAIKYGILVYRLLVALRTADDRHLGRHVTMRSVTLPATI